MNLCVVVVVVTDVEVEIAVSCVPAVLVDTSCDQGIVGRLKFVQNKLLG